MQQVMAAGYGTGVKPTVPGRMDCGPDSGFPGGDGGKAMEAKDKTEMAGDQLSQQMQFITRLFSNAQLRKKYLSLVVDNLKIWTGCDAVGIRVLEENGGMPYDAFVGFTHEFWQAENGLTTGEQQCACVRVATCRPLATDRQILTPHGSLWTNDLGSFCRGIPDADSHRYRCTCLKFGFASLAVIPIKHRDRVVGLIHLADGKKEMFPEDKIRMLESVSSSIGEIIARYRGEERVGDREQGLKNRVAAVRDCAASLSGTCVSTQQRELVAALQKKIAALELQLP